jgi:hypothetical protein
LRQIKFEIMLRNSGQSAVEYRTILSNWPPGMSECLTVEAFSDRETSIARARVGVFAVIDAARETRTLSGNPCRNSIIQ